MIENLHERVIVLERGEKARHVLRHGGEVPQIRAQFAALCGDIPPLETRTSRAVEPARGQLFDDFVFFHRYLHYADSFGRTYRASRII